MRSRALGATPGTFLAIAIASAIAGCGERPIETRPLALSGDIVVAGEATAAPGSRAHVSVYHAWSGEGPLRHAIEPIESFEAAPGAFRRTIAYPIDQGEGLLVYAWLDADGDGLHCTPAARTDPAGLAVVEPFPTESVEVRIVLDTPCVGPEHFFPR